MTFAPQQPCCSEAVGREKQRGTLPRQRHSGYLCITVTFLNPDTSGNTCQTPENKGLWGHTHCRLEPPGGAPEQTQQNWKAMGRAHGKLKMRHLGRNASNKIYSLLYYTDLQAMDKARQRGAPHKQPRKKPWWHCNDRLQPPYTQI